MISIVICSINNNYLARVSESIALTIGVEYELLVWNNIHENKGLCFVYNTMAKQARFEIICFLHEDIIFETKDWGRKLLSSFADDNELGVIGVAGSKCKARSFSGWFTGIPGSDYANIIHQDDKEERRIYLNPENLPKSGKVVCIDGVFIATRKNVWDRVLFDEKNVTGFHLYDLDFSLRASQITSVAVTFEILVRHITKGGDFGNNWVKESIKYHVKNCGTLPVMVAGFEPRNVEIRVRKTWLDLLKHYDISWSNKLGWIAKQKLLANPAFYYGILKFLFYKPLRLRHIHKFWPKNA